MPVRKKAKKPFLILWLNRAMALVALLNLGLVLFDLSYIPRRDLYLRYFPDLTRHYGERFKGIEPHRTTEAYLELVDQLQAEVADQGLQSAAAQVTLTELQQFSADIIRENPFQLANKTGNFERVKNLMRDRMGRESATQAFNIFWSQPHLQQKGWVQEMQFFNTEIRPLVATNYWRGIDETGEFINQFWQLDLPFLILFAAAFNLRVFYLRRRHPKARLLTILIWRWYDLFLFLPFWRWLRVIPVVVRLHEADLINLTPLRNQISQTFVSSFAVELTQIVVVRVIDQLQDAIRTGEVTQWFQQSERQRRYIQINGVNELEVIVDRLVKIVVYKVLPEVKPEVAALLNHNLNQAVQSMPLYHRLRHLPGLQRFPEQFSEQLADQVSVAVYGSLAAAFEDPVADQLTKQLADRFGKTLRTELQQQHTLEEFQALLVDFLEEVKINYVKRLSEEDLEQLWDETQRLNYIVLE